MAKGQGGNRPQPKLLVVALDRDVRATPDEIFDPLHQEFRFELDVCALPENAKCDKFYTPEHDGLFQKWAPLVCWCNPPYSELRPWIDKAYEESLIGATVVMLLPSTTDTAWFHEVVWPYAEVRFLRGRVKFVGQNNPAPFGSLLAIFRPGQEQGSGTCGTQEGEK